MKLSPVESALRRVGTASAIRLADYAEGVHWTTSTKRSLEDLRHQVCADRLTLASELIVTGDKLLRSRPPQYRSAISRHYYAMYHSARAVVFFEHKGDDHEAHSTLPTKLPRRFPNSAVWQNNLKSARGLRNDADYDPYPRDIALWRPTAVMLSAQAAQMLTLATQFLRAEGCAHV